MKTLHSLIAGLRPTSLILARRIALPLLLLTAGLVLIQPCAGQSGTWDETGSLANARDYHTATLLPNGQVLVAGGIDAENLALASAELYDPASGTWSGTGSLATARGYHTATLLPNGQVLVAGGIDAEYLALASAELYDPATGTWTATGSLTNGRYYHTATLLPNGQVLVAGGIDAENLALASAELYDPATGTWTATGNLDAVRFLHTATLLPNGQVLVTGGGFIDSALASAELYDPVTGTWTATGSLTTGRDYHTATLLPNGQVLVTGGINVFNGGYLGSAELYDPASGAWSATGSLATARAHHTATLLPNGKVLVAGGLYISPLTSAELYDPATGTWAETGSLNNGRLSHTATPLPDGKVLVAGGADINSLPFASAELYLGAPTATSQPLNISTRANVGSGDNVLIGGIIISGSDPATVVFRALGRSLAAFGVTGVLDNPTLELHDSTGAQIAINFDWKENSAEDQMVLTDHGLAPTDDFESAIVMTLDPGAYTAIVSGENDTTGVSLVEAYNLSSDTTDSKFANISTRGNVGTGENVMIGGFILGGGGGGFSEVIVRGIGPSLTDFGVTDALADPFLELHDSEGTVIASNDNWMDDPNMETVVDRGLAPSNPNESALYQVLPIGAYTAILNGVGDTTGVGLVEVYQIN